jgi:hypothetical protein
VAGAIRNARVLISTKKEQLIVDDRTAEIATELVAFQIGIAVNPIVAFA